MLTKTMWLASLGILAGSGIAVADEYDGVDDVVVTERRSAYSYAWSEPAMYSQIGIGVTLGGGLTGFTDQSIRDTLDTNVGGMWGIHATIGTHIPVGLDLNYNGSVVDMNAVNSNATGMLVGTNLEAALRLNILPHNQWNPFVFAGIGWQRYDLRNIELSTADSSLGGQDDVAVFPMGAGLAYRTTSGFVADVRGTFRIAQDSTLLRDPAGPNAELHTWDAGGNVGYEF